ncbi:cobalamin-dependent protein [Geobacter pelophilus]|uniref:Cobalamin-dependent protein n=1 Tax=Geoanaerobacter pelophilus TaxID=60036 RepID=A0AAW4L7U3_9BACT|nr:cobalamin-dependent protein [Geoanaerobacter pelophilus]MBT0665925.1 cobalamin-dependent protein [Geoanaerobacter pelophilus]
MDTDRDKALLVVHNALQRGFTPEAVVFEVVVPSIELMMQTVSENQGGSLAQHFMAAQIASEVVDEMLPLFHKAPQSIGSVIIGTSQGDFHGLGKRIVGGCLKAMMVEVIDLGLNVAPERFIDEAVAHDAQVIGISSMMVHTAKGENGCCRVRELLKTRGLEDKIKIAVGGAPYRFNPQLYAEVGADTWAENGIKAGKVISDLIREVHRT